MPDPRLVARSIDHLMGWAALVHESDRCVYGGVGEVSIYLKSDEVGKGIGTTLPGALIERSETAGFWT